MTTPSPSPDAKVQTWERISEHVYRYRDTCSVYVIVRNGHALLIDFGAGRVLDYLLELGVDAVDWVLHTHHHRDQCQGDDYLVGTQTQIAVPEREAALFNQVEAFWATRQIFDQPDCSSLSNSHRHSIPVVRHLADYAVFEWQGLQVEVLPTPGHTRGSVTYLTTIDNLQYAFCGDLICAPGRVWTLFDLQWHYSNPDAVDAQLHSVLTVRHRQPDRLCPSHGDVLLDTDGALALLEANLRRFYHVVGERFLNDLLPPLAVDHQVVPVSDHLIAVTHSCANFYLLRSESGAVLLIDYGFPSAEHLGGANARFVEHSFAELERHWGIDRVDVVIPTHYHDDHVAGIPFLQRRFGAEVWMYDKLVDVLAHPHAYRLPYVWSEPIIPDRVFGDEEIAWCEYRFQARHMPGHTWYAVSLFGEIDGRRVAITGDELLYSARKQLRGVGPVYRNRVQADSFSHGIRTIQRFAPDLLLTGHDGALAVDALDLVSAYEWAVELENCFRLLAASPDDIGFCLDPDAVSMYPYQAAGRPSVAIELSVRMKNYHAHRADGDVRLRVPVDWTVEPAHYVVQLDPAEAIVVLFLVTPPPDAATGIRYVITADVQLGDRYFGEAAECLITLEGNHDHSITTVGAVSREHAAGAGEALAVSG
jgi:glyoxylase-like metal-dependent hydrolase (beta-lactamase superfamily II)